MSQRTYPQVLLLGCGLNRAYGSDSWDQLIDHLSECNSFQSTLPMPLKVILATKGSVTSAIKSHGNMLWGTVKNSDFRRNLQDILSIGFDDILTTNYSYELEIAAIGSETITSSQLNKNRVHTADVRQAEGRYFLHTYQNVDFMGTKNRIWHIHGIARNPSSVIIDHYQYGNLFSRIKNFLEKRGNQYVEKQNRGEMENNSWIDSFILGELYVLGFGYGVSEFDLWWLLERKRRERAETGPVHFYQKDADVLDSGTEEKLDLLQCYNARIHMIKANNYKDFYSAAIKDIRKRIYERKH